MARKSHSTASVFRVPLACEAAPEIGCGVRAKPLLQTLERHPVVAEAWLNRAGNLLAIVWTREDGDAAGRRQALSALRSHAVKVTRVRGAERANVLSDLAASSSTWYRSAGVDRLSREEARTIAARLIKRVRARTSLTASSARSLERIITAACESELILRPTQSASARKRRIASAVLRAARGHLDAAAFRALTQAAHLGHRPLPAER